MTKHKQLDLNFDKSYFYFKANQIAHVYGADRVQTGLKELKKDSKI